MTETSRQQLRETALRALERALELCGDDPKALATMRKITGLTLTDPVADRAVIDRRIAENHRPMWNETNSKNRQARGVPSEPDGRLTA